MTLCHWLSTAVAQTLEAGGSLSCTIVTGYGKSRKAWDGRTDARQRTRRCFAEPGFTSTPFPQKPRCDSISPDLPKLRSAAERSARNEDV